MPRPAFVGAARNTPTMAYDEALADSIREQVQRERGLTEKKMFGGLAFLLNGNMAVSASGSGGLLLRVDPAESEVLVTRPAATRFEMRGREMDGWLRIDTEALTSEDELAEWIAIGVTYAKSLPKK